MAVIVKMYNPAVIVIYYYACLRNVMQQFLKGRKCFIAHTYMVGYDVE